MELTIYVLTVTDWNDGDFNLANVTIHSTLQEAANAMFSMVQKNHGFDMTKKSYGYADDEVSVGHFFVNVKNPKTHYEVSARTIDNPVTAIMTSYILYEKGVNKTYIDTVESMCENIQTNHNPFAICEELFQRDFIDKKLRTAFASAITDKTDDETTTAIYDVFDGQRKFLNGVNQTADFCNEILSVCEGNKTNTEKYKARINHFLPEGNKLEDYFREIKIRIPNSQIHKLQDIDGLQLIHE